MNPDFTSGGMTIRHRANSGWAPFLALVVLAAWSARSDAGQERAPRRPPEPFRVFAYFIETADTTLKANLEEALPMVRERVERRGKWFRLAESAETADITLRITNYRQGHPRDHEGRGRVEAMGDCWAMEFHYVDAVALAGDLRAPLSGLDHRCVETGPSLRNAASHLAEELERFAKDNYTTLAKLRATPGTRERRDGAAAPPPRNPSP